MTLTLNARAAMPRLTRFWMCRIVMRLMSKSLVALVDCTFHLWQSRFSKCPKLRPTAELQCIVILRENQQLGYIFIEECESDLSLSNCPSPPACLGIVACVSTLCLSFNVFGLRNMLRNRLTNLHCNMLLALKVPFYGSHARTIPKS